MYKHQYLIILTLSWRMLRNKLVWVRFKSLFMLFSFSMWSWTGSCRASHTCACHFRTDSCFCPLLKHRCAGQDEMPEDSSDANCDVKQLFSPPSTHTFSFPMFHSWTSFKSILYKVPKLNGNYTLQLKSVWMNASFHLLPSRLKF